MKLSNSLFLIIFCALFVVSIQASSELKPESCEIDPHTHHGMAPVLSSSANVIPASAAYASASTPNFKQLHVTSRALNAEEYRQQLQQFAHEQLEQKVTEFCTKFDLKDPVVMMSPDWSQESECSDNRNLWNLYVEQELETAINIKMKSCEPQTASVDIFKISDINQEVKQDIYRKTTQKLKELTASTKKGQKEKK